MPSRRGVAANLDTRTTLPTTAAPPHTVSNVSRSVPMISENIVANGGSEQ